MSTSFKFLKTYSITSTVTCDVTDNSKVTCPVNDGDISYDISYEINSIETNDEEPKNENLNVSIEKPESEKKSKYETFAHHH